MPIHLRIRTFTFIPIRMCLIRIPSGISSTYLSRSPYKARVINSRLTSVSIMMNISELLMLPREAISARRVLFHGQLYSQGGISKASAMVRQRVTRMKSKHIMTLIWRVSFRSCMCFRPIAMFLFRSFCFYRVFKRVIFERIPRYFRQR